MVIFTVNNTDMIKISHVMTINTNKRIFCVLCITSFETYIQRHECTMYMREYVLQAK